MILTAMLNNMPTCWLIGWLVGWLGCFHHSERDAIFFLCSILMSTPCSHGSLSFAWTCHRFDRLSVPRSAPPGVLEVKHDRPQDDHVSPPKRDSPSFCDCLRQGITPAETFARTKFGEDLPFACISAHPQAELRMWVWAILDQNLQRITG